MHNTLDAMENFNYADKNSLSRMKHAHDTALAVFQVKPKTWKSKPSMTSIDISSIKSPDNLKFQEIKKFCFNQKLPMERSLLVDQELKLTNSQQFFYCRLYSGLLSKSLIR